MFTGTVRAVTSTGNALTGAYPGMSATLTAPPAPPSSGPTGVSAGWIEHWDPEDAVFWAATGKRVARRNLAFSILSEHLAFSVWVIWSVLVVVAGTHPQDFPFLNPKVQGNADRIFWLVALPNLIGAVMRVPYTVAVARFGGRTWTTVSSLLLLIPITLATWCVTHPGTPYWFFLLAAATAGVGGGNFASSMANISYFYPERVKGAALGLNAAGGNIGLSTMQFVVPMLIFFQFGMFVAAAVWFPLVLISAFCAYRFMDNLRVGKQTLREQAAVLRRPHAWVMSFLYIGTFGSFLGLAAAFPAVMAFEFPASQKFHFLGTGLLLPVAFLGPLVGSLARPLGGALADRIGGARVTAAVFLCMGLVTVAAIRAADGHSLAGFIAAMLVLFAFSGTGNGSAYRMIPAIYRRQAQQAIDADPDGRESILLRARREGSATLGMAGACGAIGGFILPKAIGNSIKATGGITTAFSWFVAMYALCLVVTLAVYVRRGTPVSGV
jgi:MFS transporter, NNP family, nitrate/nitrite transporter